MVRTRAIMAGLLFISEALCYLDRISVAVAVVHLRLEGVSEERLGLFLAAFFWGYVCSQVGLAARRKKQALR